MSESIKNTPELSPGSLHHRTALDAAESVVRDDGKLPPAWEVPGFSYPAGACINPSDSVLFRGTITTTKTNWRGSTERHWNPQSDDISLILSLSLPYLCYFFFFFFSLLSLSYLLSHKTHTIDSGIWPCLHLNSSRGISKNFHNSVLTKGHLRRGELWLRACCSGLSQSPQLTFQFCQVSKTIYNWAGYPC